MTTDAKREFLEWMLSQDSFGCDEIADKAASIWGAEISALQNEIESLRGRIIAMEVKCRDAEVVASASLITSNL